MRSFHVGRDRVHAWKCMRECTRWRLYFAWNMWTIIWSSAVSLGTQHARTDFSDSCGTASGSYRALLFFLRLPLIFFKSRLLPSGPYWVGTSSNYLCRVIAWHFSKLLNMGEAWTRFKFHVWWSPTVVDKRCCRRPCLHWRQLRDEAKESWFA